MAELDRLREAGVSFGVVLADAGYGTSAAFRHGLDARGLRWAVGIAKNQKVRDAQVQFVPPTGRARKPVPDQEPREAEAVLAALAWRRAIRFPADYFVMPETDCPERALHFRQASPGCRWR